MIKRILSYLPFSLPFGDWRLMGWDTFGAHEYEVPGRYLTKKQAFNSAKRYLRHLEKIQNTKNSDGQNGIQDQVSIRHKDGALYRVLPDQTFEALISDNRREHD